MTWRVLAALLAATLTASGCATPQEEGCLSDSDCKSGLFCQSGACLCRTDDACGAGNYCNPYGSCQVRPACIGNQDCNEGFICNSADPSGGACIAAAACGSSLHCAFNQYCNPSSKSCSPGCRSTGDCELGKVCAGGTCIENGTASDCTLCPASPDPDPSYCDPGEQCSDQGECVASQYQSQLCTDCTAGTSCGGDLICLIDPETNDTNYCAPSCRLDLDCPSGYSGCGGLSLVFEECRTAADCSNGGECVGRSEANRGFCTCTGSQDCDIYTGICQEVGKCVLDVCAPGQAGSCGRYGSATSCLDRRSALCPWNPFGASSCQLAACAGPQDCARYGTSVTCSMGVCVGPACTSGDDCLCMNARCVLDGASCTTAADCMAGLCVADCASDGDCMCMGGRCALTDLPCETAADCAINCEEGSCVTAAKACGKESGVSCQELVSGNPECRQY